MPSPLTFEPIFKENLWGGRRLPKFLNRPAPHDKPIGEAWVLSDVDGSLSVVSNGPFVGQSLRDLLGMHTREILGDSAEQGERFPLLLKFIDARQELSVQVHPNDEQAVRLVGPGQRGKTEAWVILDADPATSRIYAGFRNGMTGDLFREAMAAKRSPETLHSYTPSVGDCVFLRAGTVHAIGANILLFEVQQTSDITYRLYDWDRVDAKTKQPRELHIDKGLACSNFAAGPCHPVPGDRTGELVGCEYFTLHRHANHDPFRVGASGQCRVIVGVAGRGELHWKAERLPLGVGRVVLLPAVVGACDVVPDGSITVLECGLGPS